MWHGAPLPPVDKIHITKPFHLFSQKKSKSWKMDHHHFFALVSQGFHTHVYYPYFVYYLVIRLHLDMKG